LNAFSKLSSKVGIFLSKIVCRAEYLPFCWASQHPQASYSTMTRVMVFSKSLVNASLKWEKRARSRGLELSLNHCW